MNKNLLIALAAIAALTTVAVVMKTHNEHSLERSFKRSTLLDQWKEFKQTFGKRYADQEFERYRIGVFA